MSNSRINDNPAMNPRPGDVWHLVRGDAVVAELVVEGPDMPWFVGRVRTDPAFELLRPLFAELHRLVDEPEFDEPARFAAVKRIWQEVRLVAADGSAVSEWALYIDDDQARWRWTDNDPPGP